MRKFFLAVLPCAIMLSLGVMSAGFFLGLGAKAGQITGEIIFPAPVEPAPSFVCYGSTALRRPLCKAVTPEQLQRIITESDVAE